MRSKILYRTVKDFGIHPIIATTILLGVFYQTLDYLLSEISDGVYYGYFLFIIILFGLLKHEDTDILKINFKNKYLIILVEAFLLSLPFIILSIKHKFFYISYAYLLTSVCFPVLNFKFSITFLNRLNLSRLMPDYEWVYGVRKFMILYIIGLCIFFIGITVNNPNLSIAGILLFFISIGQSYSIVERKELLFSHGMAPEEFVNAKINSVLKKTIVLSLFLFLVIAFAYTDQITLYSPIFLAVLFMVANQMLSKYARINNLIGLSIFQGAAILIALVACVYPYLLILNLLFFIYLKREAIKTIKYLFND